MMDDGFLFFGAAWITLVMGILMLLGFARIRIVPGSRDWLAGYGFFFVTLSLNAVVSLSSTFPFASAVPLAFTVRTSASPASYPLAALKVLADAAFLLAPSFFTVSLRRLAGRKGHWRLFVAAGGLAAFVVVLLSLFWNPSLSIEGLTLASGLAAAFQTVLWIPFLFALFSLRKHAWFLRAPLLLAVPVALLYFPASFAGAAARGGDPSHAANEAANLLAGFFLSSLSVLFSGGYVLLLVNRLRSERDTFSAQFNDALQNGEQLVGIVSHDIGGAIAAMKMGFVAVNEEIDVACTTGEDAGLKKVLSLLKDTLDRMAAQQHDLVAWYRITSKRPELRRSDIAAMLNSLIASVRAEVEAREMLLDIDLQARRTTVFCDRDGMKFALRSLLSNALRFSPNGSTISVALRDGNGELQIEIINVGIGCSMTEGAIERLNAGVRIAPTKSAVGDTGSGMGLMLARRCIRMSGGSLSLSNVNDGVCCLVLMPTEA